MGGYALYVWPSFLLTALVMFTNLILALRKRRKIVAKLQLQEGT